MNPRHPPGGGPPPDGPISPGSALYRLLQRIGREVARTARDDASADRRTPPGQVNQDRPDDRPDATRDRG